MFASFLPAVSRSAVVAMGRQVRRWRIHLRVGANLADLARWMNPIVRGWMQYYGAFNRSALYPLLRRINTYLVRWGPQEVSSVARVQQGQSVVAGVVCPVPARVRPVGVDPGLPSDRMVRAV